MRMSARATAVKSFIVMDVMEAARAEEARGRHVIHMEVGQPGTPAPAAARAAVAAAMERGALGYTVALGLPELRARIAALYRDWYGVDLDPGRVVVTAGSSAGFILAFTSLFERGDRVAVGEPGLSVLPQHPAGARPGAGRHRRPARGPLPAAARRPDAGPRRGCWWRARPTRPAPCSRAPSSRR